MGSTGRWALVAASVAVLGLTGCGDDDEPTRSEPEESGPPAPCEVIDEADVEAAFGEPVPAGGAGVGSNTVDDVAWESTTCGWGRDDVVEVQLALATAEDFQGGELLCPELRKLGTPSEPVTDLGEEAYWVVEERLDLEGKLRICTDDLLIDVEAEVPIGSRDPDTLREQTLALGRVVLDELG